ncbi:hypothetical protein BGX28_003931 [Mortierella sp. GBA30]|nr:hypothetical protein BGX28_003931 [Mortierella sp. GBA30]
MGVDDNAKEIDSTSEAARGLPVIAATSEDIIGESSTSDKPCLPSKASRAPMPTYNILLLGQTQAGKTTFIEAVKQYVEPNCSVDIDAIGDGCCSKTEEVTSKQVETNFAEYNLIDTSKSSRINPMQFVSFQTQDAERQIDIAELLGGSYSEYKKMIARTDDLEARQNPNSTEATCSLRIFDTPGLDDTKGQDEKIVADILSSLQNAGKIHLVLILIALQTPMTRSLVAALDTYSKIFSEMGKLWAFVFTKVDPWVYHPSEGKFEKSMASRKRELKHVMGRDIPHFVIDCHLDEDRPAYLFLRQRMIRRILLDVKFNVPVPLTKMQLHKTEKMVQVDKIIVREYQKRLEEVEQKYSHMDEAILSIDHKIDKVRYSIREEEEHIHRLDNDDFELIYEHRFEEDWNFKAFREERAFEKDLDYVIDHVTVKKSGINIMEEQGGVGTHSWHLRLKRQFLKQGEYHVKLYTKRRNKYQLEIADHKFKLVTYHDTFKNLVSERNNLEGDGEERIAGSTLANRQQLKEERRRCLDMIARANRSTLHLNLFKAIARAGVYEGSYSECAEKVANFYSTYIPAAGEEASLPHMHGV